MSPKNNLTKKIHVLISEKLRRAMETQEETAAEMAVEKTEDEMENIDDDISNGQDAPLKDDAVEPEIVDNKQLVPFLCWEITKEKRRKIFLTCALYFGFFALVRLHHL